MSDRMIHRGPDDSGFHISKNGQCGLTFRRLAIVDLSPAGHQPMSTRDGRYTIVFNGEIYNHLEVRSELEAKGYINWKPAILCVSLPAEILLKSSGGRF